MTDRGNVQRRLELEPLSGVALEVMDFRVEEALDEPYVVRVDFWIADPERDPLTLLGGNGALILERADRIRRFTGFVRTVREGAATLEGGEATGIPVQIELVPALWALSLRRQSRIFQELDATEILQRVLEEALGDYGREIQLELTKTYPKREYCVQYQETDLAFTQRLMEEEGIAYAFDHEGDVEKLVLRDDNASYGRVPGPPDGVVPLRAHGLDTGDVEPIHRASRRYRHATTSVVVRDFDWTQGTFVVEDEERGDDALGRDRESYEHGHGRTLVLSDYDAGAKRYGSNDAAAQKIVRQHAHRRDELVLEGVGRVIGLAPGTTFDLVDHPAVGVDGAYLVTRVVHEARSPDGEGSDVDPYHNAFECIPLDVPHRPARRTPKPSIASIQTALVTGPSGEEIHTDEHGRIKARFYWDREDPTDETSSCWIRCEQAWAGSSWGFWWLPRVGMEVVVTFVDGDPDRPLVTGCVYDGANLPPYELPDEKTKSTIKSNSSPGGGGYNELRFEDAAGSEQIFTHAQKDYDEVVENDHTTTVHHQQTIEVDHDQTQTIGANQTEVVHGNQELGVGGDRTVHVKGDFEEAVDGTETRAVSGDVTETFDANETRDIGASVTEDVGANETRTVGGDQTEDIGADHAVTIGGSSTQTIAGALSQQVAGGITNSTPAAHTILATGGLDVVAPAGITMIAQAGIKIIAPGGVKWVDVENNWFGNAYLATKGFDNAEFCGFKLELGGLQMGTNGVKFEVATIEIGNAGNGKKTKALQMLTRGAEIRNGALRKKLKAIICYGC